MADEMQHPKKEVPRMSDGRPMPRDVQLKNELKVLEYKHVTALRALEDTVSKVRREELHKNLAAHQANHNVKNAAVDKAAAERDRAKKDAERAHGEAVRKAQSEHQKAINDATKAFETLRDTLETEVAQQNKPIHEAHQAKDASIVDQAKATAKEAQEAYEAARKPLEIELKALEEALAVKQKKRVEREAEQKALKEADEKRGEVVPGTP